MGIGASVNSVNPAYYPQFAGVVGAFAFVPPATGPSSYQSGGIAIAALSSSQRLESMFASLTHGVGCCCPCCAFAGVAFAGVAAPRRIDDDPYGISQSGQGLKSNLANSPEVMLAINDIMSDGKNHSFEDVQKTLQDKYGIACEVGDIETKTKDGKDVKGKAIKFANGDYFVDGNGNGSLDAGDYKFADAVKNIKDKYGISDDDVKRITDGMKANASGEGSGFRNGYGGFGYGNGFGNGFGYGGGGFGYGRPRLSPNSPMPDFFGTNGMSGIPGLDQIWMILFAEAFGLAA